MSRKSKSQTKLIQLPEDGEGEGNWNEYSNWKHWCRLCAKKESSNIDVFRKKNASGANFSADTLATAIGKFFWVNIKTDDELPKHVCGDCEALVNELCTFTERVNKVQTMFSLLLNIKNDKLIDPNKLRLQYGLLDEERQQNVPSPEQQEMEYEMQHELEMLVNEEDDVEILEEDYVEKENDKEEHYQHAEDEEYEEESEQEAEFEGFLDEKEEFKTEPCTDSLEEEKQVEENNEADDGDDIDLDGDLMEQISQELQLTSEDFAQQDSDNAGNMKSSKSSVEHLDIEDEDETLLSQVREEIKALKKFYKKEKPKNMRVRKRESNNHRESTEKQEVEEEQQEELESELKQEQEDEERLEEKNHNEDIEYQDEIDEDYVPDQEVEPKYDVTDETSQNEIKVEKRVVIDPKNGKVLEIIVPPKRRRGRPARGSEEFLRRQRLKAKLESSDGNVSEESSRTEFRFECSLCPKKYKSCLIYKRHMNDVHDIIDETIVEYTCEQCSKSFPSERNLTLHLRSHLPLEQKLIHPCPYCEKRFSKDAILIQHINGAHLNEKPFICEECGRGLKTHAALREHKLTHTDDCPFECEVCHKRFKNKARLKIHSDIHAETVYKCEICGEVLNTRRTLNMHMLVHSDVKAFKCDYCGNAFKRAKALKNHLLIHTGLKPYICNFCYKSFSNGSNCRSHKKKAHPEELAAMEAAGEKVQPANVPKLDQLRAVSKAAEKMQPVSKQTTLPSNWRQILLKAEARATRLDEKYKQESMDSEDSKSQLQEEDSNDLEVELAAMEC